MTPSFEAGRSFFLAVILLEFPHLWKRYQCAMRLDFAIIEVWYNTLKRNPLSAIKWQQQVKSNL